ncbi:hypothetical protein LCGC14_0556850 [marine sediment metagenome]|uniref:Uncharacterized protein n=1 Tax=marine sediment metagenome TaxID=412755 RepID=A0A0F9S6W6_9ZZZZ
MNEWSVMILVIFIFCLGLVVGTIITGSSGIDISQETADDICKQLTGNETVVAYDGWNRNELVGGKLGCELPSFDATQNIIIKQNNE